VAERIGKFRNPARQRTKDVDPDLSDALSNVSARLTNLTRLINERASEGMRDSELAKTLQDVSQRAKDLASRVRSKANALERAAQRIEAETLSLEIEGLTRRVQGWPTPEGWPPPT
jgi:vacuolar-type H+-ATPase subunit I/STV1